MNPELEKVIMVTIPRYNELDQIDLPVWIHPGVTKEALLKHLAESLLIDPRDGPFSLLYCDPLTGISHLDRGQDIWDQIRDRSNLWIITEVEEKRLHQNIQTVRDVSLSPSCHEIKFGKLE